jgi:carbonic anhydrase
MQNTETIQANSAHTAAAGKAGSFTFGRELAASLVVFLVALPLSLGIALASGAPLMAGVIAAIVGGVVVGLSGGAPLQVSGPAAGLTVIVFGMVQKFGWSTTCALTAAAGAVQMGMGTARIAHLALAISPAVIHGMLAAIGILIALSQAHVVLGDTPAGAGLANLKALPHAILMHHPPATAVGLATIAILFAWPFVPWKKVKQIPAALVAVVATTIATMLLGWKVPLVNLSGSLFQSLHLPALPAGNFAAAVVAVLTIAFVASAESLLCAVATDKMHNGDRANLNKELIGQGAGNFVSGLIGGLPITGVIVRSSVNIASGATSRWSTVMHGLWILLFVGALPGVLNSVPLAALAGLLVYTGIRLVNVAHIRDLHARGEIAVYVVTLLAIVCTDLLVGLGIGFAVAICRLLWNLTHVEITTVHKATHWNVYVDGTLTFAAVPKLVNKLQSIPAGQEVEVDLSLRYMDHAGFEALNSWAESYERTGGTVHVARLEEVFDYSNRRGMRASQHVQSKGRSRKAKLSKVIEPSES